MKAKAITSVACLALAACLICAFATAAYADTDADPASGNSETTAQAKTPKVPKVSKVRLKSYAMGEITVTSNEPKIDGKELSSYKYSETADGLTFKSYTIRYSYKRNMKGAKTKTGPYCSASINKLKKGKRVYVQVRANMKYGKKTVHSAWTKAKSVKVDKKHKYTYTLLKKPKYFNSWDECWAYCEKQSEVTVFSQSYISLVKKVNGKWVDDTPPLWR